MFFIYGLSSSLCPEDFRYIGFSTNPIARLQQHLYQAKAFDGVSGNKKKLRWINKVIASGHTVRLTVLKQFDTEDDAFAEEEWLIRHLRSHGYNLTNLANGGKGGYFSDPERHREISAVGAETRRSEEHREAARVRGLKQFESEESRQMAREFANKRWENTPLEERSAWNKGMTFVQKPEKMVVGSEEFREHARQSTLQHFEKVRNDPDLLAKHKESRKQVGKKVSVSKKAEWDSLSEIEYNSRRHRMRLGRRLGAAKRNGWVFDLTPSTHHCKDSE